MMDPDFLEIRSRLELLRNNATVTALQPSKNGSTTNASEWNGSATAPEVHHTFDAPQVGN